MCSGLFHCKQYELADTIAELGLTILASPGERHSLSLIDCEIKLKYLRALSLLLGDKESTDNAKSSERVQKLAQAEVMLVSGLISLREFFPQDSEQINRFLKVMKSVCALINKVSGTIRDRKEVSPNKKGDVFQIVRKKKVETNSNDGHTTERVKPDSAGTQSKFTLSSKKELYRTSVGTQSEGRRYNQSSSSHNTSQENSSKQMPVKELSMPVSQQLPNLAKKEFEDSDKYCFQDVKSAKSFKIRTKHQSQKSLLSMRGRKVLSRFSNPSRLTNKDDFSNHVCSPDRTEDESTPFHFAGHRGQSRRQTGDYGRRKPKPISGQELEHYNLIVQKIQDLEKHKQEIVDQNKLITQQRSENMNLITEMVNQVSSHPSLQNLSKLMPPQIHSGQIIKGSSASSVARIDDDVTSIEQLPLQSRAQSEYKLPTRLERPKIQVHHSKNTLSMDSYDISRKLDTIEGPLTVKEAGYTSPVHSKRDSVISTPIREMSSRRSSGISPSKCCPSHDSNTNKGEIASRDMLTLRNFRDNEPFSFNTKVPGR